MRSLEFASGWGAWHGCATNHQARLKVRRHCGFCRSMGSPPARNPCISRYFRCKSDTTSWRIISLYILCKGFDAMSVLDFTDCLSGCKWLRGFRSGKSNGRTESEPFYLRSLEISEKRFGPHHPQVALSLDHPADLCRTQGRQDEAEPLYKRALNISEKALGSEHPQVGLILRGYATCC